MVRSRHLHVAWHLAAIVAAGMTLRVLVVLLVPAQPIADFQSYYRRAQNLAELGTYGYFPDRPDASYPPGYSLLLAASFRLLGATPFVAKSVNVLLGASAVLMAFLAGWAVYGRYVGYWAAILVAFYPRYLLMTTLLASENLLTPLLMTWAALVGSLSKRKEPSWGMLAAVGGVVGGMTLTRAVAYGLGFLWPVVAVLSGRRGRRVIAETVLILLVQHMVLLPWGIRNAITLDNFSVLTSTGGINLFIGNNPAATGAFFPWTSALESRHPGVHEYGPFERDAVARDEAIAWVRENPRRAVELYVQKLSRILNPDQRYATLYAIRGKANIPAPNTPALPEGHSARRFADRIETGLEVGLGVVLLLAAVGIVAGARRWRQVPDGSIPGGAPWLAGALYFPAVAAVFLASTRFRWPMVDLLLLIAACGGVALTRPFRTSFDGQPRAASEYSPEHADDSVSPDPPGS